MKRISTIVFTTALLLSVQPVQAGNWAEDLLDWFTGLFTTEAPATASWSNAQLDSLRATPLGLRLTEVPDADTLKVNLAWPQESMTVTADLERYDRLLRETVVLTDPRGKLPLLEEPAIRVIYRQDQRPATFLALAARFVNVQEIPFDALVPQALPIAADLPTVVLIDDPVGGSRFNADWYTKLFAHLTERVTCLHFGDPILVADVPRAWTLINSPLRSKESESFLAQAIFGAQLLDGRLTTSTPTHAAGTGYRLEEVRGGFRLP
ncbi:MAG: hypothetical protein AAFN92_20080, partial [Bacteroidota bacterium]